MLPKKNDEDLSQMLEELISQLTQSVQKINSNRNSNPLIKKAFLINY